MAFKLSKGEEARRQNLIEELRNRAEDLDTADRKNEPECDDRLAAYNSTVAKVKDFVEEVHSRLTEEFDEKSDAWQESERGGEVADFIAEWEMLDTEDAEMPGVDDEFESNLADDLESLPESV